MTKPQRQLVKPRKTGILTGKIQKKREGGKAVKPKNVK